MFQDKCSNYSEKAISVKWLCITKETSNGNNTMVDISNIGIGKLMMFSYSRTKNRFSEYCIPAAIS